MSNLRRDARCLIRQREPIGYWQLCFPTRFNELHKVARHASRRSFRFLSKPVAPFLRSQSIISVELFSRKGAKMQVISRTLLGVFAPLQDIIFVVSGASVASHVALSHPIRASCFGRNFTLWLQSLRNTRQRQSSIHLLNNVDTCWPGFGYQLSCSWRWPPEA